MAAPIFLLLTIAALLIWRLWRFTVRPLFHPEEPKALPYWIPFIGHAWSFLTNSQGTLECGRHYFRKKEYIEPHCLNVAGQQIYVISSYDDAANLVRTMTNASLTPISMGIHSSVGVSKDCLEVLFGETPDSTRPVDKIIDCYKRYLTPGRKELETSIKDSMIPHINRTLDFDQDIGSEFILAASEHETTISLLQLCAQSFLYGLSSSFLGRDMSEFSRDWKPSWMAWERSNWKVFTGLPAFARRDGTRAAETIVDSLMTYLSCPEAKDNALPVFKDIIAIIKDHGLSDSDAARILFLHVWAITGNAFKLVFWAIIHAVHDPQIAESIRQELVPAIQGDAIDETYVNENCPVVNSFIDEMLRITVVGGLVREIATPTVIAGKMLLPGRKVIMPTRSLHFDRRMWGQDADAMDHRRFAEDPKLAMSKAYRPFGSGLHTCPGRFFAKRVTTYMVALVLHRYDLALEEHGSRFPRASDGKPGAGVPLPIEGDDVILIARRRKF